MQFSLGFFWVFLKLCQNYILFEIFYTSFRGIGIFTFISCQYTFSLGNNSPVKPYYNQMIYVFFGRCIKCHHRNTVAQRYLVLSPFDCNSSFSQTTDTYSKCRRQNPSSHKQYKAFQQALARWHTTAAFPLPTRPL